jgi:hypothetical protein
MYPFESHVIPTDPYSFEIAFVYQYFHYIVAGEIARYHRETPT